MFMLKYPNLFSPIKVAGQVFKNRIFAAPTGWIDLDKDGMYPPDAALYYARKAMGGAASVTLGECGVDGELGVGYGYAVRLDNHYSGMPYSFHGITRVVEEVTRYGAICAAELEHAGMYANRWKDPPGVAYGPVDCVDIDGRNILQMPEDLIERTIQKYADAAAFVKQCGVGMIFVHAGHGWLLHQFMSPSLNTRNDKWGGPDIENRSRLAVAVLDAIRKAVGPAIPIEVRISGSEGYEGGYDIEEGIKFAKQLDGHADIIHVSAGSHEVEEVFTLTHPSLFREDGCNVHLAAEIKKHVKSHVATVGALSDPELMEDIIASRKADIVELARALFADPDLPAKIRSGRQGEVNRCMRCLACFSNLVNTGRFRCAINPETGREAEVRSALPPRVKKKVLVAGGGVAGMQAAITCARNGHQVVLCEKKVRLGGVLNCEENVPFKRLLKNYLNYQAETVAREGVEIRLGTTVTPGLVKEIAPDAVISAVGAAFTVPDIKGIDGANVFSAEDAYIYPEKVGGRVIILGAGLVGMELAIYLSILGRKATIVEMLDKVNDGGNYQHMKAVWVELNKYGVELKLSAKAVEIDGGGVLCETAEGVRRYDSDTVIYAVGQKPLSEEAFSVSQCAPEFYPVGDCVRPENIMNATSMAYMVARSIGKI